MNSYWKSNHPLFHRSAIGIGLVVWWLTLLVSHPLAQDATANAPTVNTIINVSAASYLSGGEIATESIVAGFGIELATATVTAASLPLPTELAGVRISVKDDQGVERFAPLFFVSPNQINYQIPPGTVQGTATMTVTNNNNVVAAGSAKIVRTAPGLFAANANGQGLAIALALRIRADGSLSYEPVAQYDAAQSRFVPVPINMGPASDQIFLVLYGTGIKFNIGVNAIGASLGGLSAEVLYAGAAPGFAGLDQINLRMPRSLAGRGQVEIAVSTESRSANPLFVNVL